MGFDSLLGRRRVGKPVRSRRSGQRPNKWSRNRSLRIERFEDRLLLSIGPALPASSALATQSPLTSGPMLLSVIPNQGNTINEGDVLHVAPEQLTLQFNQNEQIDPKTVQAGIKLTRTDAAGNTTTITPGYIAVNDAPNLNQVIIRFSQTLLSGTYHLTIFGSGATPLKGTLVPATGPAGKDLPFNGGVNLTRDFTLDLGAMVSAVVPQPVTRNVAGQLQQAVNEIDVYFTDPLNTTSAQNPQFYQLLATSDTANTNDDTVYTPTSVTYNSATKEAQLYFYPPAAQQAHYSFLQPYYASTTSTTLSAADYANSLSSLAPNGTRSLRLRIGDFYQPITTTALAPAAGVAGTTYAGAMPVVPASAPSGTPSFGTSPYSYVISNEIQATSYDLQWPGSSNDPGSRKLPDEPDVAIEGHFMGGTGENPGGSGIPTITYNFPDIYGADRFGNPLHNQITPQQEADTRAIFTLFSYYFGAQFEEVASTQAGAAGIGVVTGDLYPMGQVSGGGIAGVGGGGMAVMDADQNWGNSAFGGAWTMVAAHEIMHNLGFGHSFDLPPVQVMGDDATQGTSDLILPGMGDLTTALHLFKAQSADIDMYQVTLSQPGTISAETIAQRLPNPSLLNTELRLFQLNPDGTYSPIAANDDYFSYDSYLSMDLPAGTYFVGVTASGNNKYDPSTPDSGMGGTTVGPYELRLNFTPDQSVGPAQGTADGKIILTGSFVVNTGTTPFAQSPVTGGVAITGIGAANVAALNGETFTITNGNNFSYTFEFVDTSSQTPAPLTQGNIAIYYQSASDSIGVVQSDMVSAINAVFTELVDATGTAFDGDADGNPGGVYDYWFNVAGTESSGSKDHTLIVDKSAKSGGTGTLAAPYNTIGAALTTAGNDSLIGLRDIVRIEGNHTVNDNPGILATISDNQAYEIGTNILGAALADNSFGSSNVVVPKNVSVMIDAGAVFKLYGANIQVGSSAVKVDQSGASLQVLGTPLDEVYFTSYQDGSIGLNDNPLKTIAPKAGDWGGLVFENDVDQGYDATNPPPVTPRAYPEAQGIFLDYVNDADIVYGGGSVSVNGVKGIYDSIHMIDARITANYNTISQSADAAMSADPDTFLESEFQGNQAGALYTADYNRVGPSFNANTLTGNSVNGLLVRIRTQAGQPLDMLTVSTYLGLTAARLNARDLTYVIPENLEIQGQPGGPLVGGGTATSHLLQASPVEIETVGGGSINDGDTFGVANGQGSATFEFDGVSLSVLDGTSFSNGDLLTITDSANAANDETFEFGTAAWLATNPPQGAAPIVFTPSEDPGAMAQTVAAAINWHYYKITAADPGPVYFAANNKGPGADALPYTETSGESETSPPDTVAIYNFTTTESFAFKAAGAVTALKVAGTPGVKGKDVRIVFHADDSPETVANNVATALVGAGIGATVNGQIVTVGAPPVTFSGLVTVTNARWHAGLIIDPGVVVKLSGSRIEAQFSTQVIAEGTANNPVVLTSVEDDRYGAGGTFDLTGDGFDTGASNTANPGDWGGLYFAPAAQGSIDHAVLAYAGGTTTIEGGSAGFNAIETRQAHLRVADSLIEYNAGGTASDTDGDRNGRGGNGAATIYVLGAQPVIADNIFENNAGPVISIDVNSLNATNVPDWGRSTGPLAAFSQFDDNDGPLVRGNRLGNNGTNGMLVRGGVLSTQSVWDDTDIVHVVESEISSNNEHGFGGIRLESSPTASLVIKLQGANAGFTASGTPLEFTDRIGGEVQVLGQPGYPVVLTSLNDNSVGAGLDLSGNPQNDTCNNAQAVPQPGDWRSILLDEYSNDNNVAVVNENEPASGAKSDVDATGSGIQALGELATSINTGNDNLRLGFEVHGSIMYDMPNDVDTYSFSGTTGTQVYIAMEQTSFALDSVLELIDANGNVIARSDNKVQEDPAEGGSTSLAAGAALPFQEGNSMAPNDDYSDNMHDPALRVVLPGTAGQVGTYYVRVYSALSINNINATTVPNVATLNGTSFQVADSNTLAIGDIDASHVPNLASLNGMTFQVTDGNGTPETFEFIDDGSASPAAPILGDQPIHYNDSTDTIDTVRADMVAVINASGLACTAQARADGTIAISGLNVVLDLGQTGFVQVGSTHHGATFEFIDASNASAALTPGDLPIYYRSTADAANGIAADTMATILNDMVLAINGYTLLGNIQPLSSLNGQQFQIADTTGNSVTFEFIDNAGTPPATKIQGDQYIHYNSTTDTTGVLRGDIVTAVNGAGLVCQAVVQPYGVALFDPNFGTDDNANFGVNPGSTPFVTASMPGAACGVTAAARPNDQGVVDTIALYGFKIVAPTDTTPLGTFVGTTPFAEYGRTSGIYQLQVRLQCLEEIPGSVIQYSSIHYATNGIDIKGLPNHSPFLADSSSQTDDVVGTTATTLQNAQDLGNLLQSNDGAITVTGNLSSLLDVNWYKFELNEADTELDPQTSYPTIFNIGYADGMARPDTVIWVFDSAGDLIYKSGAGGSSIPGYSNIADNETAPLPGGNGLTNPNGNSEAGSDPYLGPIQLDMADSQTYYVAVTGLAVTANALSQSLARQEPVDSVQRVVENHVDSNNGSNLASNATTSLTLTPAPFTLGDVTLYANTGNNLYTVNPFTGEYETEVTGQGLGNDYLPQTPNGVTYGDVAMRPDGELYTLSDNADANGAMTAAGQYMRLNTGDARTAISDQQDGLVTYDIDPQTGSLVQNTGVGVNFNAMAFGPLNTNNIWPVFAVGNLGNGLGADLNGVTYTSNLLYELDNNGAAMNYPKDPGTAPRLGTNVTPLACLSTSPTIVLPTGGATDQTTAAPANDITDGMTFTVTDSTTNATDQFEFDCGIDVHMDPTGAQAVRDGQTFTLSDGTNTDTFQFRSGPVLTINTTAGFVKGDTFQITNTANPPVTTTFEFTDGTVSTGSNQPVNFKNGDSAAAELSDVVTAVNNANIGVTAAGFLAGNQGRISLNNGAVVPTILANNQVGIGLNAVTGAATASIAVVNSNPIGTNIPIDFLETEPSAAFGNQIASVVNQKMSGIFIAGYQDRGGAGQATGGRLTFYSEKLTYTGSSFAGVPSFTALPNVTTNPTDVMIYFGAGDTSSAIATRIANKINGQSGGQFNVVATAEGGTVALSNGSAVVASPLTIVGPANGKGGNITGMAFLNGNLYCVTDKGDLDQIENYDQYALRPYPWTQAEQAAYKGVATLATVVGGANLVNIANISGIQFSGLTAGPANVESAAYANMLFATDASGTLYAFNALGKPQAVFVDGATSVQMTGPGNVALSDVSLGGGNGSIIQGGLTFSNIDYNLWHETSRRKGDAGHGITWAPDYSRPTWEGYATPGGDSMYFGLEDPRGGTVVGAAQPGAFNYTYQNSGEFQSYDMPGGAHGSLISSPFSLAGYVAQDCPEMFFTYYLDGGGPIVNGNNCFDTVRVFASADGAKWSQLGGDLTGLNNGKGWLQAALNLSGFAGQSSVRLRFDFSTAGDMHVGDQSGAGTEKDEGLLAGAYLTGIDGDKLQAGSPVTVKEDATGTSTTFAFNMGAILDVPADAGSQLANGQTITVNDGKDAPVVFWIDNSDSDGSSVPGGDVGIIIAATDTPAQVTTKIAAAINAQITAGKLANLKTYLVTDTTLPQNRVEIVCATAGFNVTPSKPASGNAITLENNVVGVPAGDVPIIVNFSMSAQQVAAAVAAAFNKQFAGGTNSTKLDGAIPQMMHIVGLTVSSPGLLPYGNALPGDHPVPSPFTPPITDRYHHFDAGQDNLHEGIYVDDIVVGFIERGEMITATTPDVTFSAVNPAPKKLITNGGYQLQIREAPMYGSIYYPPKYMVPGRVLVLDQSIDTNDRMAPQWTLALSSANTIRSGDTFAIYDGITLDTFQFVIDGQTPSAGDMAIYYTGMETRAQMAALVITAINGQNTAAGFGVTATADGAGNYYNRVDLFGAQNVVDTSGDVGPIDFDTYMYDVPVNPNDSSMLYAVPGDQLEPRLQGEVIVDANLITDSLQWGVVIEPGARDAVSQDPHPGVLDTLSMPNKSQTVNTVGGVTVENCAIAGGESGGIHISGDPDPAGEPIAAMPFDKIINNTIYGFVPSATLQFTKLTGLTGKSNQTAVYVANLSGLPFNSISSLTITDNSGALKGDTGQYSGLELDGLTLSANNVATAALASALVGLNVFDFTPAGTALTAGAEQPVVAGVPLFGTLNGNVNNAVATLGAFDANGVASKAPAGFVAIGINGAVTFTFTSPVNVAGGMFLYIAEADDKGAVLSANITVANAAAVKPTTGIAVDTNASPTITNSIFANLAEAVTVDASSASTVLQTACYQNITDPNTNAGAGIGGYLGNDPVVVAANAPLFADAAHHDFYLVEPTPGTRSPIDSALNTLPDRQNMINLEASLGMPQDPIMAPDLDMLGQLRTDDPNVPNDTGLGSNIFKDRGAIDRVDRYAPTAQLGLVEPPANDPAQVDPQWVANDVTAPAGQTLTEFAIQLLDQGTGINNNTVSAANVTVYRSDNPNVPLVQGTDYFFSYDTNSHVIYLAAGTGVWAGGYTYKIQLDATPPDIQDMAGNALAPNRNDGSTYFTVTLVTGVNFSHAPNYAVAWHSIVPTLYLGHIPPVAQAYFVPSLTRATDDGVDFSSVVLAQGQSVTIPVFVTNTGGTQAYLNAWIDFNDDDVFGDSAAEQIAQAVPVNLPSGSTTTTVFLTFTVPATAPVNVATWARFRLSTTATLPPDGGASDGEVEDYQVTVVPPPPTPAEIDGTVWNDLSGKGVYPPASQIGLGNWTIELENTQGTVLNSTQSQSGGTYKFTNVTPGTYDLVEVPQANWNETYPKTNGGVIQVVVTSGNPSTGNDFEDHYILPPMVTSITAVNPTPTNLGSVQFLVTFSEAVTGLDTTNFTDFAVVTTGLGGTPAVTAISPASGYSSTYTVTVSTGTGDGTLQLNLNDNDNIVDQSGNPLDGVGTGTYATLPLPAGNGSFIGPIYTIDRTAPTILALGGLVATDPNPTNAQPTNSVHFTATFSEAVKGVDPTDFAVVTTGTLTGPFTITVSPTSAAQIVNGTKYYTTYQVTVNAGVRNNAGTLTLNLLDDGTIQDDAGNALAAGVNPGPSYNIDTVNPLVLSVAPAAGQLNPATQGPVTFTVTFSKPVANFGPAGVDLTASTTPPIGALTGVPSPNGAPQQTINGVNYYTSWNVAVSGMAGSGSVVLKIRAGAAVDYVGNPNLAGSGSASVTFTMAMTVVVTRAASPLQPNPTNKSPINFTVTFSQPPVDFTTANRAKVLSFAGSTVNKSILTGLVGTISPIAGTGGTSYNVAVSGLSSTGELILSIPPGAVHTAGGAANTASSITGASAVFYDIDPPSELLASPAAGTKVADATLNGQGYILVSYSCNVGAGLNTKTILNGSPKFTLTGTAIKGVKLTSGVTGVAEVNNSDQFKFFFTGTFVPGTVTVNFLPNTAEDNAGNWNKAATYSFTVMRGVSITCPYTPANPITKPASGTTKATFTVTLTGPATAPVTVKYSTASPAGSNTTPNLPGKPGDYTGVTNGTLTIPAGKTSGTISITLLANAANTAPTESFVVSLSSPTNALLLPNQSSATCNIVIPPQAVKKSTPAAAVKLAATAKPATPAVTLAATAKPIKPAAAVKSTLSPLEPALLQDVAAALQPLPSSAAQKQAAGVDQVMALLMRALHN